MTNAHARGLQGCHSRFPQWRGGYENLRGAKPVGGVEKMAMPQRDDTIEAIKRLDALLEYAVMHGDEEEAERIREELRKLTESV